MNYKDYYKILGVNKNSTDKEIKKAYYTLAKKHHPDVNKDKGSEAKLKEINEAYEVLSDKDKRQKYETLGSDWDKYQAYGNNNYYQDSANMGGKQFYGSSNAGFSDFFEAFFGGNGGGLDIESLFGGMGGGQRTKKTSSSAKANAKKQKPKDETFKIEISLEDAYKGGKKVIKIPVGNDTRTIEVNIPKGVKNDTKMRITGENNQGDVFLNVKLKEHEFFKLENNDLHCEIPITDYDAVLGSEIKVPTLSGTSISLKIPPNSNAGKTFRLKDLGMPTLKSEEKGFMYIKLKIVVPKNLNDSEIELYSKLKELRIAKDNEIRENLF